MCEFQSLYFDDDGYIVRCKQCSCYQVAFISTMLTLAEPDFQALYKLVKHECNKANDKPPAQSKTVALKTPSPGVYIVLTRSEAERFCKILEQADNEVSALKLISLFNP